MKFLMTLAVEVDDESSEEFGEPKLEKRTQLKRYAESMVDTILDDSDFGDEAEIRVLSVATACEVEDCWAIASRRSRKGRRCDEHMIG